MAEEYDVKLVKKWKPIANGVPIITMPNIPRPLFNLAPRTVLGKTTWDHMRKRCYFEADYKCEVSGVEPERGRLDAHELYEYDYAKGTAKFIRTVALSKECHNFIHSGRMLTLFKSNSTYMPMSYLLRVVENGFKLVYDYNQTHSKKRQLRVYATFLDYLKEPRIADEIKRLIDKYEIKFYKEDPKIMAKWGDWKMIMGNREYQSLYKDEKDWAEKTQKLGENDYERASTRMFVDDLPENASELLSKFF